MDEGVNNGSGSSSSDEEDHFEEGFLEAVTKSAVIERVKDKGDKDKEKDRGKFYFYLLAGGSLFEYRTVKVI